MHLNARHKQILDHVNLRGSVSVNELADLTAVSLVTIRNDLTLLHERKYLLRVHGSAVALEENNLGVRIQQRYEIKRSIAEFAATLISEGDTLFLDGGSTTALLIDYLKQKEGITIVTTSHQIAGLFKHTEHTLIVLGGVLQRESESVVGPLTLSDIRQIPFQKAFLSVDGWHPKTGFTAKDMLRSDVTSAVLNKGIEAIALADSSKFGQIFPYPLMNITPFRRLITDNGMSPKHRQYFSEQDIQMSIVKSDAKIPLE